MILDSEIDFQDIAVRRIIEYTNRPTIIFLHDSLGSIELWRDFPEKLGKQTKCNILIYDRQGYGNSCKFSYSKRDNSYLEIEADILNSLMAYWKLDDAILFGHSDGGSIALIAGGKYPNKIKGIVTEGAHIFVEDITLQGIREVTEKYHNTNLKSKLERYHGVKTEEMFWAWASTWTNEQYQSWNIEHFLPKIKCPSFIVQGEEDEFGSLKQLDDIIKGVGDHSDKWIIPKVKHSPHKEVPDLLIEKTADFIMNNILI